MRYLIVILLIGMFCSCRVTRNVEKTRTILDSSAIRQVELLKQARIDDKAKHEKELKEASTAQIIFKDTPCDTGKSSVTIGKDGSISATGQIKSASVSNKRYLKTIDSLSHVVDSISSLTRVDSFHVITKRIETSKHTTTKVFYWWWIVALIAGFLLGTYRKRIFSTIKLPFMKSLILCFLTCLFLTSCADATSDHVSFSQAFSHCMDTSSFVIPMVLTCVAGLVVTGIVIKGYQKEGEMSAVKYGLILITLAAIAFAVLYRPSEVAANTTLEQAARGVWLGY